MTSENETWLIEAGELVITKLTNSGIISLTRIERAIYCFWVVDYSVRNSGTLCAMEDSYPNALLELNLFAQETACVQLSLLSSLSLTADGEKFGENFYYLFELACGEIRFLFERT